MSLQVPSVYIKKNTSVPYNERVIVVYCCVYLTIPSSVFETTSVKNDTKPTYKHLQDLIRRFKVVKVSVDGDLTEN